MIAIDADSGPLRYVLWCCGSICHQLFTFIQIGCGHTKLKCHVLKYVCKKINVFFDLPSRNFFLNFFVNWKELSFFFAFSFIFFTYIKKIELEQSTFLAKLLNYKTFNAIWRLWTHCCIWWRTMDLKKYKDKKKKKNSKLIFWAEFVLAQGAFTYDVRCFWVIFYLPTYPNQIL